MSTFLEELEPGQLDAINLALEEMRQGKQLTVSFADVIEEAPTMGKETELYRYYKASDFKEATDPNEGYYFEEDGYIVATKKRLEPKSGAIIFKFIIPASVKAIPVGDDIYILDQNQRVYFSPTGENMWNATVDEPEAMTASVPMPTMFFPGGPIPERCEECGMSSINEFYNRCHSPKDGKFCSNRTGIRGKVYTDTRQYEQRYARQHNRGRGRGQGQGQHGPRRRYDVKQDQETSKLKQKLSKVEQALVRTQRIVLAATAVVGVVITISSVLRASDDLKRRRLNRQDPWDRVNKNIRRSDRKAAKKGNPVVPPTWKNPNTGLPLR